MVVGDLIVFMEALDMNEKQGKDYFWVLRNHDMMVVDSWFGERFI